MEVYCQPREYSKNRGIVLELRNLNLGCQPGFEKLKFKCQTQIWENYISNWFPIVAGPKPGISGIRPELSFLYFISFLLVLLCFFAFILILDSRLGSISSDLWGGLHLSRSWMLLLNLFIEANAGVGNFEDLRIFSVPSYLEAKSYGVGRISRSDGSGSSSS